MDSGATGSPLSTRRLAASRRPGLARRRSPYCHLVWPVLSPQLASPARHTSVAVPLRPARLPPCGRVVAVRRRPSSTQLVSPLLLCTQLMADSQPPLDCRQDRNSRIENAGFTQAGTEKGTMPITPGSYREGQTNDVSKEKTAPQGIDITSLQAGKGFRLYPNPKHVGHHQ